MANEVTTTKQSRPIDLLKNALNAPSVQEQFRNALGENKDLFVASIIDVYTGDKSLQKCQPAAVIAEALRAATLKLPLNRALGWAYIVTFNNSVKQPDGTWQKVPTPAFIIGYKGYLQLAMRTGFYKNINADIVYEGELTYASKLKGEISLDGKKLSDKVIGYFCYFELLNGFSKTLYMSVEDMANYAIKYSPSFGAKKPSVESLIALAQSKESGNKVGWLGNFNDMALKTVIRRLLSKYGYMSIDMQNAAMKEAEIESTSMGVRNEVISVEANSVEVDTDEAAYDVVDTKTGEVITQQPQQEQAEEDEMPAY